jgi:hypothetical protein
LYIASQIVNAAEHFDTIAGENRFDALTRGRHARQPEPTPHHRQNTSSTY